MKKSIAVAAIAGLTLAFSAPVYAKPDDPKKVAKEVAKAEKKAEKEEEKTEKKAEKEAAKAVKEALKQEKEQAKETVESFPVAVQETLNDQDEANRQLRQAANKAAQDAFKAEYDAAKDAYKAEKDRIKSELSGKERADALRVARTAYLAAKADARATRQAAREAADRYKGQAQVISNAELTFVEDNAYTASATATSGLEIVWASVDETVCTVDAADITILSTGLCVVTADQEGNEVWAPAPTVTTELEVTFVEPEPEPEPTPTPTPTEPELV